MAYEIFKSKLEKEDYFKTWDTQQFVSVTEELRDRIYSKYLLKCEVFNRDNFTCQNQDCLKIDSTITLHHIKWQKNGGKDSARNGVCLCEQCHQAYHKAKKGLRFANADHLPPHIKGHKFKLDKPDKETNWKVLKKDMRVFRRSLKEHHGIRISLEQLALLLQWLDSWETNARVM